MFVFARNILCIIENLNADISNFKTDESLFQMCGT